MFRMAGLLPTISRTGEGGAGRELFGTHAAGREDRWARKRRLTRTIERNVITEITNKRAITIPAMPPPDSDECLA